MKGAMSGPQRRSEMKALLDRHGIRPKKALGQHFLADPNIVERIVRAAELTSESNVVEVGAGTGTLTRALAATGARVIGFEVDTALEPLLEEALFGVEGVELRFKDVTKAELQSELGEGQWVMVANVPYHVGTRLLLDALRHTPAIVRFVVMVQREVADRLTARPGRGDYGLPSVIVGFHATIAREFVVPPQVFLPAPAVESAVIVLDRVSPPEHVDDAIALAAAAFGQRRKMLRRSLAGALVDPGQVLAAAGIDPTSRAEMLSPEDFVRLAITAKGS